MKKIIVLALTLTLVGCAKTAMPNYFNGNYYMAGDSDCTRMRQVDNNVIMCTSDDGVETGYRYAMTQGDMQMYQSMRANEQAQIAQLNQQLQQTGESFRNTGQQMMQQSQSYTAPQVQSYGSSRPTTYNQVGNSLIGSDGSSCTYVGQSIICR